MSSLTFALVLCQYLICSQVSVADVVFMSLNTPNAWYYTSRSGRIAKKSKQNVTIKSIYRTYKNIAKSYGSERYIAVVHRGSRSTVVSDSGLDDFRSLLKGADSISSFIPPRIRNISGNHNLWLGLDASKYMCNYADIF